jgi:hypothetical protein
MFDRVGDVDLVSRDAGRLQRAVEESAGGADERVTFDVLTVAGLFADDEQRRVSAAFAEDGLCAGAPQRTRTARRRRAAQLLQRTGLRGICDRYGACRHALLLGIVAGKACMTAH